MSESRSDASWHARSFGEMAVLVNDRVDNPSEADVDYYVGLEHLDSESLTIRRWGTPSEVEATKLRFRAGDIIFGRRRVYQRKLAVADFDGICSAHAMVLRAKPDVVLPEFLPFFMQSDIFMERAKEISVGSLSPTINWKTLASEVFAVPPLDEQRRIAEALSRVESARRRLVDLCEALEAVRKAALVDYFRCLLADSTVKKVRIDAVGEVLMGRQRSPEHESGPSMRPYLRVANVFDGYIDATDVKQMAFSESEYRKFRLIPGDVLLNEGQSRELVGRSAIYRGEVPGACFQNTLIRFRPLDSLSPEYAQRYFQYLLYTSAFASAAKQTTSIAHLGVLRFAQMTIPVPESGVQAASLRIAPSIEERLNDVAVRSAEVRRLSKQLSLIGLSEPAR